MRETFNPISGKTEKLLFNGANKIIVSKTEVNNISKFDNENAKKNSKQISFLFAGIAEKKIQNFINSQCSHCKLKPIFDNEPLLKPVTAKKPMERMQIDLVSMIPVTFSESKF